MKFLFSSNSAYLNPSPSWNFVAERVTFLSSGKKHVDEKSFDENDEVKDKEKPKKSSKKSE